MFTHELHFLSLSVLFIVVDIYRRDFQFFNSIFAERCKTVCYSQTQALSCIRETQSDKDKVNAKQQPNIYLNS